MTYLLRGSKGVQLSAREHTTGGKRDFSYFAEDNGMIIQIAQTGEGLPFKSLAKEVLPEGISKDTPRTLEFRADGETLTLTLNDSVTVSVKDAVQSDGVFAMAALKGVLIQRVEIQRLDQFSVNLLSKFDSSTIPANSKVSITNGILEFSGGRLPLPVENLPDEYDVRLRIERKSAGNALVLGLVSGGQRVACVMDGFQSRGGLWGLENIDGKAPPDNGTAVSNQPLKVNEPAELLVQVRKTGIRVERDGKPLIDWKGTPDQLSLGGTWDDKGPARLFLGAQASFVIHRLEFIDRVRPLVPPTGGPKP